MDECLRRPAVRTLLHSAEELRQADRGFDEPLADQDGEAVAGGPSGGAHHGLGQHRGWGFLGGRACPGSTLGHVVKVRLEDGLVTPLTDPTNEAGYSHGSARATDRPGWFYVTYARDTPGKRFNGEIVAVKLDGSGAVQRFGQYHGRAGSYRAQAHAVPSPDGRRVLFASDWTEGCDSGCGGPGVIGAFVIDGRDSVPAPPAAAGRVQRRR